MENRNCPNCGAPAKGEKCEYCGARIYASAAETNVGNARVFHQAYEQAEQVEELSLWGYYVKCLKNYANFNDRARRKEYWAFVLFNMIISFAVAFFGVMLFGEEYWDDVYGLDVLYLLYSLAVFIPSLAVLCRRFHDTGRSGWSWLWVFTIIGIVPVFIWLCSDSQYCENEYGPCPK